MSADQVTLAYAAGIIDGEGCIRIIHPRKSGGWTMNVEVCTTDPRLVLWLRDHFGGAIRGSRRSGNRKDAYTWKLSIRQAAAFIVQIRPFLVIKGEQADLALAFSYVIRIKTPGSRHRLTAAEIAEREGLFGRMKILNLRGRASA